MKNNDKILVDLFGKEVELSILCTGDNQFDEEGDYKEDENFELLPEEVEYIQWFVKNVKKYPSAENVIVIRNMGYVSGLEIRNF